jgi:UDP-N-acetylglucosamine/UDP-N-acetyl-alpha-D-glucosaminouronate 4-epimerase
MKVLVTGGGGFIGSHIVERLLVDGKQVRILDNFATGRRENLVPFLDDIEVVEGDLQSYERAHNAVSGCDLVSHQAALPSVPRSVQDPLTSNASNVTGTLNVLLAARDAGVQRVVCASSSSVYGATKALPKSEELPTLPISPYAVAKVASEGYCRAFSSVYDLETVALRYFSVYGPRQDPLSQYAAVIPNFITAALDGRPVTIFGDGHQSRDFTYVGDVVDANLAALTQGQANGSAYNVASGERTSLRQLVDQVARATGRPLEAEYAAERPGDIKHSHADVSAAQRDLGYGPRVSFEEGIRHTVAFYESTLPSVRGA